MGRVLQKGFLGEDKCRSPKGKEKEEKERGKQSAVRVRAEEKIKQGWYISTPLREVVCQCMTLERLRSDTSKQAKVMHSCLSPDFLTALTPV